MAPKGTAFLYARPDAQPLLTPAIISHGWTADGVALGPFGGTPFQDRFQFQATRDPAGFLAIPAAIAFRQEQGWDKIIANCCALAQETGRRVASFTGRPPIASSAFCAPQMVAMPVPDCDPMPTHDRLLAEFGIEIPVIRWQGRSFIRVSVQGYNSAAEVDRLCDAIDHLFRLA